MGCGEEKENASIRKLGCWLVASEIFEMNCTTLSHEMLAVLTCGACQGTPH